MSLPTTQEEMVGHVHSLEGDIMVDGGEYGYGGEWFPHKEVDVHYVASLLIEAAAEGWRRGHEAGLTEGFDARNPWGES